MSVRRILAGWWKCSINGQGVRAALACAALLAANPVHADSAAGRLKARPCTVCHGELGISVLPNAPHLAGQPEQYLAEQLKAYRSGKRANDIMSLIAKPLNDADIDDLAAWFASIAIEAKAPK
ncbi:MAG: cytochrome c [Betaproteobacteria bacterium]